MKWFWPSTLRPSHGGQQVDQRTLCGRRLWAAAGYYGTPTTKMASRWFGNEAKKILENMLPDFLYARLKNGTYYAVAMSVRPSVRLSVRPSVRPRFPDFSSTCFEISIWNLVYTFSRWHDMSSLTYITIGSFWPSLQPKVGQTHFLQSWPHKSR